VVNACRYSLGYQPTAVEAIVEALEEAIMILSQQDRELVRAIQETQAKSCFSGMAFLSSFYDYMYQTGLWKRITYHAPTKIFDLNYFEAEIAELLLDNGGDHQRDQRDKENDRIQVSEPQEIILPINSIRLDPNLYPEEIEGGVVVWLRQKTTLLVSNTQLYSILSIAVDCHWIPDAMQGKDCTLTICGIGQFRGWIPTQHKGSIHFDLREKAAVGILPGRLLLISLTCTESIELADRRKGLTVVCRSISLRGFL
jgi:hypothetical protein